MSRGGALVLPIVVLLGVGLLLGGCRGGIAGWSRPPREPRWSLFDHTIPFNADTSVDRARDAEWNDDVRSREYQRRPG